MNKDLEQLSHWFKTNKLSLNISKTNCIVFTLNKTTRYDKLKLNIDNSQIHMVDRTKFLGIHIDSRLHWHVKKKISSGLYALNSSKHILQESHMKTLYHSLVQAHLIYGCLLWGNTYKTRIKQIEVLQRKAIRAITKCNYNATTSPLFRKTKILKFSAMYNTQISTFMYPISQSIWLIYLLQITQYIHITRDFIMTFTYTTDIRNQSLV